MAFEQVLKERLYVFCNDIVFASGGQCEEATSSDDLSVEIMAVPVVLHLFLSQLRIGCDLSQISVLRDFSE